MDAIAALVRELVDEARAAAIRAAAGAHRAVRGEQHTGVGGESLTAVGVAAPGPLDSRTGIIIHAPNLFWHDVALADGLADRLGVPVRVDNDANLAALAEWAVRRTAGGHYAPDPLLYVTVSTGIGGGVIARGEIFHGFRDAAAEVGHMTVVPAGADPPPELCHCGNRGCLETVASGTAIARLAGELAGEDVGGLYAEGDPAAAAVVEEAARWLGLGLANLAAVLDPEVIVVGGGVSRLGEGYLDVVRDEMRSRLMPRAWEGRVPPVEAARLGDESTLTGAALLALRARDL